MIIVVSKQGVELAGTFNSVILTDGILYCDSSCIPVNVIGDYEVVQLNSVPVGFMAHEYEYQNGALTKKPKDLTARRLQLWEEIKAHRDNRVLNGGFPAGGYWFYSDLLARSQHLANARLADLVVVSGGDTSLPLKNVVGYNIMIKSIGNGNIPVTAALALEIVNNATVQEMGSYGAALYHKAVIDAATTLDSYDYTTHFPPIYGEIVEVA